MTPVEQLGAPLEDAWVVLNRVLDGRYEHVWVAAAQFDGIAGPTSLLEELLQSMASARVIATNDVEPLLLSGAPRNRIVVSLGTGSAFMSIDSNGKVRRCGGLEFLFSDEGSSFALGSQAVRIAIQVSDGRQDGHTRLAALAEEWFELPLRRLAREVPIQRNVKSKVAGFAASVCCAAREGDRLAQLAIDRTVAETVQMIYAVSGSADAPWHVDIYGGLPAGCDLYLDSLLAALSHSPRFTIDSVQSGNDNRLAEVAQRVFEVVSIPRGVVHRYSVEDLWLLLRG